MIIIGIDTAIRTTGYGVISTQGSSLRALDCGIIKNSVKLQHSECMRRIAGGVRTLIERYHPDALAIEDAFLRENVKTAMILSLARGAAITAAAEAFIPIYGYAPRKVKKMIFGNGSAQKQQMAVILSSMLNLDLSNIPLDATDALSIAICHFQSFSQNSINPSLARPI